MSSGGKLTTSKRFKDENEDLFPFWDANRHETSGFNPLILIPFIVIALYISFEFFNLTSGEKPQSTEIAKVQEGRQEFSDGTFIQVLPSVTAFPTSSFLSQETATPSPTSNRIDLATVEPTITATPLPTQTQGVTMLQQVQMTATQLSYDLQTIEPASYDRNIQVTPADGRWVFGYYEPAFCPTGYDCPCYNGGCEVQVPQNYGCDLYGCGYGHGVGANYQENNQ